MPDSDSDEREPSLDALVAAYLFSQGRRQVDIAQQLGVSQPEVSRYITRAKRLGWLRVEFVEHQFPQWMDAIRQRALPPVDLQPRLQRLAEQEGVAAVSDVQVLPSPNRRRDPRSWDESRLPAFAAEAARRLQILLQQARVMGVTWGETNRVVVQALCERYARLRPRNRQIVFVPLSGEPLTNPVAQRSSASTLVAKLHAAVNGSGEPLSLNAVPAMIPRQFAAHVATIRGFLGWINGYRAIFGEPRARGPRDAGPLAEPASAPPPLVERLDTVLTGVGVPSRHSRSVWLQERLVAEGFRDLADLAALVIGDIGGCYLPRPDLTAEDRERVRGINARWTGIQVDDLGRCAERAAGARPGKGPHGVVILALGNEKAEIVAECVRRGIASRLIIDHELAQALAARLPA